jgi:hypothetical protein
MRLHSSPIPPGLIYNSALRSADIIHEGNPSLSGLTSACRRNSSAIIGGWLDIVEITVTRTPRRWTASTRERKDPSPENRNIWSICARAGPVKAPGTPLSRRKIN